MSAGNIIVCFITQADDRVFQVEVDQKSDAQECFDKICKTVGILDEAEYFGLQYLGHKNELLWLNMRNRLTKQITRQPYNLYLRVKFFVPPHLLLLQETRHQFYLNISRQLKTGAWNHEISNELQGQMIAVMAQAEFGNFNISTTPCKYACFWPDNQDEIPAEVIRIAAEHHRSLENTDKSHIEYDLLRLVSLNLPLYGTFFYDAKDCFDKKMLIGVGPDGVVLCNINREIIEKYPFTRIQRMTVSERVVYFSFNNDDGSVKSYGYRLVSRGAATSLYRCVTETHAFLQCDTVRNDVVEQTCRDIKNSLVSFFSDHTASGGRDYMFDIRRTSREVYDNARRRLYKLSKTISDQEPPNTESQSQMHHLSSRPTSISSEEEVIELRSKLERMRDAHICRICMDRIINRVFFPCGHSVCCQECSERIDACPWCRKQIDIRHPLYMAWPSDLLSDEERISEDDELEASHSLTRMGDHESTQIPAPGDPPQEILSTETLTDLNAM